MLHRVFVVVCAFIALSACLPTTETISADDPRQMRVVQAECDLYYAIAADVARSGIALRRNPTEGCPAPSASLPTLAPLAQLPTAQDKYPETLYRRMIARGVPSEVAVRASKSAAFWNAVAVRNEVYSG